jgi:hypothetical protein
VLVKFVELDMTVLRNRMLVRVSRGNFGKHTYVYGLKIECEHIRIVLRQVHHPVPSFLPLTGHCTAEEFRGLADELLVDDELALAIAFADHNGQHFAAELPS